MPRSGSGTYVVPAGTVAVSGQTISSTAYNAFLTDLSTAMTDSLDRSGLGNVLANINWGGFRITSLGDPASAQDAATKNYTDTANLTGAVYVAAAGGSADAITGAFSPAITSLVNGMRVRIRFGAANVTTTPTFAADSTGAKTIVQSNNQAMYASAISGAGFWGDLVYDGTNAVWVLTNPAPASLGPANTIPTGVIMPQVPSLAVPTGWLECNGQLVSRTTYSALYTAISTTYGPGDGSTTFGIPDYRGLFLRGYDHGSNGFDAGRSASGTSATVTITIAAPGVVTWTAHGFHVGQPIWFTTSGSLPTGLQANTIYYVSTTGLATNSFSVSTTCANAIAGTNITTSGSQSGTHTGHAPPNIESDAVGPHTHTTGMSGFTALTGAGSVGFSGGGANSFGTLPATTGSTGTTETRPLNMAVMYIIKT